MNRKDEPPGSSFLLMVDFTVLNITQLYRFKKMSEIFTHLFILMIYHLFLIICPVLAVCLPYSSCRKQLGRMLQE